MAFSGSKILLLFLEEKKENLFRAFAVELKVELEFEFKVELEPEFNVELEFELKVELDFDLKVE